MGRFVITEEERSSIRRMYLLEQVTSGTTPNTETKVAGPFGVPPLQYYIYSVNGKFYIYQTNASQKTPILMQGTIWNNNGQGYNTQNDAQNVILDIIKDSKTMNPDEESNFYQESNPDQRSKSTDEFMKIDD